MGFFPYIVGLRGVLGVLGVLGLNELRNLFWNHSPGSNAGAWSSNVYVLQQSQNVFIIFKFQGTCLRTKWNISLVMSSSLLSQYRICKYIYIYLYTRSDTTRPLVLQLEHAQHSLNVTTDLLHLNSHNWIWG
jgi:hypothetical protein